MSLPTPPADAARLALSVGTVGAAPDWGIAFGALRSSYETLWMYYEIEKRVADNLIRELETLAKERK